MKKMNALAVSMDQSVNAHIRSTGIVFVMLAAKSKTFCYRQSAMGQNLIFLFSFFIDLFIYTGVSGLAQLIKQSPVKK